MSVCVRLSVCEGGVGQLEVVLPSIQRTEHVGGMNHLQTIRTNLKDNETSFYSETSLRNNKHLFLLHPLTSEICYCVHVCLCVCVLTVLMRKAVCVCESLHTHCYCIMCQSVGTYKTLCN